MMTIILVNIIFLFIAGVIFIGTVVSLGIEGGVIFIFLSGPILFTIVNAITIYDLYGWTWMICFAALPLFLPLGLEVLRYFDCKQIKAVEYKHPQIIENMVKEFIIQYQLQNDYNIHQIHSFLERRRIKKDGNGIGCTIKLREEKTHNETGKLDITNKLKQYLKVEGKYSTVNILFL